MFLRMNYAIAELNVSRMLSVQIEKTERRVGS